MQCKLVQQLNSTINALINVSSLRPTRDIRPRTSRLLWSRSSSDSDEILTKALWKSPAYEKLRSRLYSAIAFQPVMNCYEGNEVVSFVWTNMALRQQQLPIGTGSDAMTHPSLTLVDLRFVFLTCFEIILFKGAATI